MQELKKVGITIVQVPEYVTYECPHCGNEIEVDFNDFEDDRTGDCWLEWVGDTVIRDECGEKFQIENVEVD